MTRSSPTTRRSFFGLAGGAALLCTIGGEEVDVSAPGGLDEGRRGRRAGRAARAPPRRRTSRRSSRSPGGIRREYWIQAETRALGDHADAQATSGTTAGLASRNDFTAYVYRLMTPGFADYAIDHPTIPGPTLIAEVGDVLVVHFRNADTQARPGGDDAPARRQVQPRVRRRLHGRVHARGRVHRARRVVHLPVGVHARVGRRLAVPRPRPQPHAQHVPRPVRLDHRAPARARSGPTACTRSSPTSCRRRSPGLDGELPLLQRPRVRRQHADADARASARTSRSTPSAWTPTSTRSTSTATAGRIRRGRSSTTRRWGPNESVTARFVEDNPGRWLYHCHVFSHQDAGMAGWYVVDP